MYQSKRTILFSILAIILILNSCKKRNYISEPTGHNLMENHVDSIVKPFISDSLIAGAVVAIAQGTKTKLIKSYGFSDISKKTILEITDLFPIASVTKTFTAIAIMQLIEKGLIKLDDNIVKFIDFDTKDKLVTIGQLLNHTSGIKDYTESNIPNELNKITYSSNDLIQLLEVEEFDFEPGAAMDYSNSGYFILGLIIKKVSGLTYEQYLKQNIFTPLNMLNTTNCYSHSTSSKIVSGYNMNGEGNLNPSKLIDFQMAKGAGSLCSTVEDLLKWQVALHHSNKLINRESYDLLTTPNKLQNGSFTKYGLGLEINQYEGNKVFSHNGVIEGYLSDTRYFPESDLTIITLINTLGQVKPANVSNSIAALSVQRKNIFKSFEGRFSDLTGSYAGLVMGNKMKMDVIEENKQLFIESRGSKIPLQYIGQNTWLAEDGYTYGLIKNKMQVNAPKLSVIFEKIN